MKTVYLCLLSEGHGLDHSNDRTNETASTDVIILDSVARLLQCGIIWVCGSASGDSGLLTRGKKTIGVDFTFL